ncbi:MAG TPA: HEAT repeat domain-containing protein [Myxococcales bacterium]|nr:HEAT repeat domain-containing protein [Myxococcales bacterium]
MPSTARSLPLLALVFALGALGKEGPSPARLSPEQFSLLAERLEHGESFKVRIQAALILGEGGGPPAEPVLREVLRDDANPSVRAAAALALVDLDGLASVPPLVEALGDEDGFVRGEVGKALSVLAQREGSGLALPLANALANASDAAKPIGLAVLSGLGSPGADGLVTLLGDSSSTVRAAARSSLEALPKAVAGQALERGIRNGSFGVRAIAAQLAGEWRDAAALPALADAAADATEVPEVQEASRRAIAEMKDAIREDEEVAQLKGASDPQLRVRALVLLAGKAGPAAEPACEAALRDASPLVRAYAVESLGALGDRRALPALRELLHREDYAPLDAVLSAAIHRIERSSPSALAGSAP